MSKFIRPFCNKPAEVQFDSDLGRSASCPNSQRVDAVGGENYLATRDCGRAAAWDKPRSGEKRWRATAVQDAAANFGWYTNNAERLGVRQSSGAFGADAARKLWSCRSGIKFIQSFFFRGLFLFSLVGTRSGAPITILGFSPISRAK